MSELTKRLRERGIEVSANRARLYEGAVDRIDKLEECLREAVRNLDSIANWRREALSYDADMDNPPRSFCEDIELVEQAAKDAADKARALLEESQTTAAPPASPARPARA